MLAQVITLLQRRGVLSLRLCLDAIALQPHLLDGHVGLPVEIAVLVVSRSALLLDAPSNYLLLAAEFEEGLMIQDRNCLCFGYGRLRYAKVSKET